MDWPAASSSSSQDRTTQPVPSGLSRLLSSRCSWRRASASLLGLSLMTRTRPKLPPMAST